MEKQGNKKRIAIFASGNGTNAENIIRYFNDNERSCGGEVALIVCNRPDAMVLQRADRFGVPSAVMTKTELNDPDTILPLLDRHAIDMIVLAGFLLMMPVFIIERYQEKIINIHPSLLPKYGGKGMYGHHVHAAVVAAGETETGITVHFVSERCDEGNIIFQTNVPVAATDTPEDVERKSPLSGTGAFPTYNRRNTIKHHNTLKRLEHTFNVSFVILSYFLSNFAPE